MALTNGILTAPFTKIAADGQGDLQVALDRTSCFSHAQLIGDVLADGTDAGRINMWAKYKPFISPPNFPTIFSDKYSDTNSRRLAALIGANYGLMWDETEKSSIRAVFGSIWVYNKPVVGTHPLRALDFDGYYHGALPPVVPAGDITVNRALASYYDFSGAFIPQTNPNAIGWGDIITLATYYFCVAFANDADFSDATKSTRLIYKTSSTTIGQDPTVPLALDAADLDLLKDLGYTHYFLCAASDPKVDLNGQAVASTFLPLPSQYASDLTGAFTISSGVNGRLSLEYACFTDNPSGVASFVDVSDYTIPGQYYDLLQEGRNPWYLHLGIAVQAVDQAASLVRSSLTADIFPTFAGSSAEVIGATFSDMRDSSWVSRTTISVTAGNTAMVYLVMSGMVLNQDSQGGSSTIEPGQELEITVVLKQNGSVIGTFLLCLSN